MPNTKCETSSKKTNTNQTAYSLEERTLQFTKNIKNYIKILPKDVCNFEIAKQLIRSAGSIGANYIEANEAFTKKDFLYRCKISKKEAKETRYWLKISEPLNDQKTIQKELIQESTELMNILGSIIFKSKNSRLKFDV